MNVVWIEDFAGGSSSADIKQFFVGTILNPTHFPFNWLGNRNLRDNPELLEEQCLVKSSHHKIRLYSKFWDFHDWMHSQNGLDYADVILIDLNLDHGFTEERPPEQSVAANLSQAGFSLFYELTLHRGFPADKIAFFTNNSSDVERFNRDRVNKLLPRLNCFPKIGEGLKDLGKWLQGFANDPSLNLRRGIIEGLCEEPPRDLVEGLFDPAVAEEIRRAVSGLNQYGGALDSYPESVANALARPWEGVALKRIQSTQFPRWMKACRNALAHHHFGSSMTREQLALIVFSAIRATWQLPAATQRHELHLFHACCSGTLRPKICFRKIKQEIVSNIAEHKSIHEQSGWFIYPSKSKEDDKVRVDASTIDLIEFALRRGIDLECPRFELFAASLLELLPEKERDITEGDVSQSTHHATTAAIMARSFLVKSN